MCVSALILSKEITFSYTGLTMVVKRDRYAGLTLPNRFEFLEEGWALLLISRIVSMMTISKLYKKLAVGAIFRKNCNLQNFAFYKVS